MRKKKSFLLSNLSSTHVFAPGTQFINIAYLLVFTLSLAVLQTEDVSMIDLHKDLPAISNTVLQIVTLQVENSRLWAV